MIELEGGIPPKLFRVIMDDGQHLRYVIIPRDVMIKKHLKALLRFYEGMFKWAKQ